MRPDMDTEEHGLLPGVCGKRKHFVYASSL